jgi:peptidoglycan/LPS O-acetylase OafA/YrhL
MDFSARQADRNIATLDGWRAIAISLVLFSHGYSSLERMGLPAIAARERIGLLGVQIFFALSGYLIAARLISEENRQGFASLPSFYARRAFRILPAALMMILCVSLLSAMEMIPRISAGRIVDTVLFFANYSTAEPSYYLGHFWSLAVEEHFYFVWPAIFVLFSSRRRVLIALMLAVAIACWRAINWKYQITGDSPDRFFARTDVMADSILWG